MGSNQRLRRYPAAAYLAGCAALALLLPSGLTVPTSGPPTLAEYAPVPGQGEGRSDTGELGLPRSGGLGAGGAGGGSGALPPGEQASQEPGNSGALLRRPGTKRCVGSPPRQTEDPQSPPCVAFFDGDNFGAASMGVTRDSVTVVVTGVDDGSNPHAKQVIDCAGAALPDDTAEDHACRAYQKYFNDRFQAYGRTVRLLLSRGVDIKTLHERHRPFAAVTPYTGVGGAPDLGIISVGYESSSRSGYQKSAPYRITYRPDIEDQMAMAASYVCLRLKDRPARFSGNADDRTRTRKFGLWTDDSRTKPDALLAALDRQCGIRPYVSRSRQDPLVAARMRAEGVTTVLTLLSCSCYSVPAGLASQNGWFPEWVIPGDGDATRIDTNAGARVVPQEQWRNAIGITVDYRRDRVADQHWYRAYREGCPSCPAITDTGQAGVRNVPFIYDALSLLFYGIQAAGPRLTPQNVDRGLHAIPPRGSADPYRPAAYFAPGNYSFVKDATAIWWDPTGLAPGSSGAGCYRLVEEGRRYRAGEWPSGDEGVRGPGPCQGDTITSG